MDTPISMRPLLKITWLDASDPPGDQSWFTFMEADKFAETDVVFVTIGWEWKRTKKYVTLIADYQVEGEGKKVVGRLTKIPVKMIQEEVEVTGDHAALLL